MAGIAAAAKSFAKPTKGRMALFVLAIALVFYVWSAEISVSGVDAFQNPDVWVLLSAQFIFPLVVANSFFVNSPGPIIMAVYWYLLSCTYVNAWVWLDSAIKRKYPRMNAGWR